MEDEALKLIVNTGGRRKRWDQRKRTDFLILSYSFFSLEMEVSKSIIAALVVATLSLQALSSGPLYSTPSAVNMLVTYAIPPRVINATQEVRIENFFFIIDN